MDYYGSDFAAGLAAMIGVFIVVGVIVGIICLLLYILQSIGMMTLAKNRGMSNPWLAWIPVARSFTLGALADDINEKEGGKSYFRFILLGGGVLVWIFSGFTSINSLYQAGQAVSMMYQYNDPDIANAMLSRSIANSMVGGFGSLISLAFFVFTLIALNRIFKCYKPQSATSWTILCVFFGGILKPSFLFAIRNNQPCWINPPYQSGFGGYNAPPAGQPWNGGGYNPPNQGSYNPTNQGNYNPLNQSNYNPPDQGSYNQPVTSAPVDPQIPSENNSYFAEESKVSPLLDQEPSKSPFEDDDKSNQ